MTIDTRKLVTDDSRKIDGVVIRTRMGDDGSGNVIVEVDGVERPATDREVMGYGIHLARFDKDAARAELEAALTVLELKAALLKLL